MCSLFAWQLKLLFLLPPTVSVLLSGTGAEISTLPLPGAPRPGPLPSEPQGPGFRAWVRKCTVTACWPGALPALARLPAAQREQPGPPPSPHWPLLPGSWAPAWSGPPCCRPPGRPFVSSPAGFPCSHLLALTKESAWKHLTQWLCLEVTFPVRLHPHPVLLGRELLKGGPSVCLSSPGPLSWQSRRQPWRGVDLDKCVDQTVVPTVRLLVNICDVFLG